MKILHLGFLAIALIAAGCVAMQPDGKIGSMSQDEFSGEKVAVATAFLEMKFPPSESRATPGFLRKWVMGREDQTPAGRKTHVYLTLMERDPTPELLREFERRDLILHAGSKFKIGRGVHFTISTITITGDKALVSGGYFVDSLFARWGEYVFIKKDGRWILHKAVKELISKSDGPPRLQLCIEASC